MKCIEYNRGKLKEGSVSLAL
ncbi:tetracycline resistance efflux system leader peptide [Cytobacillus praedii]